MARPPERHHVDRLAQQSWNTKAVTASDSGIATSEITVVRTDSRKANSTMANHDGAIAQRLGDVADRSPLMKSAWRNSTLRLRPRPRADLASALRALDSICPVTFTVSAVGLLLHTDHNRRCRPL